MFLVSAGNQMMWPEKADGPLEGEHDNPGDEGLCPEHVYHLWRAEQAP